MPQVGLLFQGLFVGFTAASATSLAVATALGPLALAGYTVGAFFGGSLLGRLLLNIGLSYALNALSRPGSPEAPDIEAARINSRLGTARRWQLGGSVIVGGEAGIFAEHDEDGNFWYIVAHGDAEMINPADATYFFDDIELSISNRKDLTDCALATTANITLSGEQTIDGTLTSTSRVCVKDQTAATENGVYVTGPGAWTRAADMNTSAEVPGATVDITGGTANSGKRFRVTATSVTLGTDDINWTDVSNINDVAGDVLTDDFCLDDEDNSFGATGTKRPQFRLYTVTPDAASDYGTLPAAFTAAFPNLPSNFRGVGVCYTIVRAKAVAPEHYRKVYRWRGAIGIGEPSVAVYANFNRMYDPRNVAHDIDDPTTWTASDGNPAIVWAWWRTAPFGRNRPMTEINWDNTAAEADKYDATVLDRSASPIPRYRCGVAAPDNKPRHRVEEEILASCDGFVAYDDQGRAYPVGGVYAAPTLTFTRERDILTAQTEIVVDGERALDGVIVNYISPAHNYKKQPAAPWVNSEYYDGSSEPNYLEIDVLTCQNHNQAVRLGKAFGLRHAPPRKAAFGCNIKGVLAKTHRAITLEYDSDFSGVYEVATPVEQEPGGLLTAFAVVPLASDRWDLGAGEEGVPPPPTPALNIDDSLETAQNVVVTAVAVVTETGSSVRLEATFDAPTRVDRTFRFRYKETGGSTYEYFFVDMDETRAYSALVSDGQDYDIEFQTITSGGRATVWTSYSGNPVTATANSTAPADLVAASAVPGGAAGEIDYSWTTANDANQYSVALYRGATTTFGDATKITTIISGANVTGAFTETGVAAGTVYCWLVPVNGSGIAGNESGPYTVVVT